MTKNIIIAILVILVLLEGGYIVAKKLATKVQSEVAESYEKPSPSMQRSKPMITSKGMQLSTSPVAQYAYEIAPDMTDAAKKAMTGFAITTKTNADGSITVNLTPKDSDDQSQQYTIKQGQKLYFVEMTPADDKADSDKDLNYRDDYGIITDANGIIQ